MAKLQATLQIRVTFITSSRPRATSSRSFSSVIQGTPSGYRKLLNAGLLADEKLPTRGRRWTRP